MKKTLALVMVIAMMFTVFGCGTGTTDAGTTNAGTSDAGTTDAAATDAGISDAGTTEPDYSSLKVAALLPGSVNDNGWNGTAYNALQNLKDKYGVTADYTENVSASDMEEFLRGYATQGYSLIICHGSQFTDAVHKVAPEFPDVAFVLSASTEGTEQAPNVAGVGAFNSGYLAGAIAAAATKTGKVAMIGGEDTPSIAEIVDVFEPGAKHINPDVEVITTYLGTLTDADKAKEVALNLVKQEGVDVLCASANAAGLGVVQAAQEAGVYCIGFNADQYDQAPEAVIVSVLRNMTAMFENVFLEVANGTFEPIIYAYKLKDGGTSLSDWHGWDEKLPEVKATVDQLFADLESGALDQ